MEKYIEVNKNNSKKDGFNIKEQIELSDKDVVINRVEYIKVESHTKIFNNGGESGVNRS